MEVIISYYILKHILAVDLINMTQKILKWNWKNLITVEKGLNHLASHWLPTSINYLIFIMFY